MFSENRFKSEYLNNNDMTYEFSKPEKKIVRQVIETGLQRDLELCILDIDPIIQPRMPSPSWFVLL